MNKQESKNIREINQACRVFFNLKSDDIIPEPPITFMSTRDEVDAVLSEKTEPWVRAITTRDGLFFVDEEHIEEITCHKKGNYWGVVHHEMSHWYFDHLTKTWSGKPTWLTEGLAEYMAGQKKNLPIPIKESVTTKYYNHADAEVYQWGKLMVSKLIEDYGKEKFLELIKLISPNMTERSFEKNFKKTYSFSLDTFENNVKDYLDKVLL